MVDRNILRLAAVIVVALVVVFDVATSAAQKNKSSIFRKDNLVAWCIVPFDARKRGPEARAQMLVELGIKKVAYDWRKEHVASFEQEILAYKKHGLEYFAFWSWHPDMAALIRKHNIKPQIWKTNPSPRGATQQLKVEAAGRQMLPLVKQATELGCKVGLYNHGGWGGEPENLVAVCEWLRKEAKTDQVGIIYNFHHGHGHIDDFDDSLDQMTPYLFCLNINGMNNGAKPKILSLGKGQHEQQMLRIVRHSGYTGPVGILDHISSEDSYKVLAQNLTGLKQILKSLGDAEALKTYSN